MSCNNYSSYSDAQLFDLEATFKTDYENVKKEADARRAKIATKYDFKAGSRVEFTSDGNNKHTVRIVTVDRKFVAIHEGTWNYWHYPQYLGSTFEVHGEEDLKKVLGSYVKWDTVVVNPPVCDN